MRNKRIRKRRENRKSRRNGRRQRRRFSSTPFDDAFKTLITGPSEIVVPFLNEMFPEGKTIPDDALLTQEREEFLINLPAMGNLSRTADDGHGTEKNQKRVITDSILTYESRCFHLECQSTPDGTMLIRMFEYDAQIALGHREFRDGVLDVYFPESGVLYVRESGNEPDRLKVRIHTSGTDAEYEVKVTRMKGYSIEEIFEKRLYLLIPFYLCNYEKQIPAAERDARLRYRFLDELSALLGRLNEEHSAGRVSDYAHATVTRVLRNLVDYLTRNYETVGEEARRIMGGKVIDYPERRIYNAGEARGEKNGGLRMLYELAASGDLPVKSAVEKAKEFGVKDEEDFRKRALLLNIRIQPEEEQEE